MIRLHLLGHRNDRMMARRGQTYTKEFKDSAIQLALNSEKSVLKIAKELGMYEKTLYSWLTAHHKSYNLEVVAPAKKRSSIETLEHKKPMSVYCESLHMSRQNDDNFVQK